MSKALFLKCWTPWMLAIREKVENSELHEHHSYLDLAVQFGARIAEPEELEQFGVIFDFEKIKELLYGGKTLDSDFIGCYWS